MRNGATILDGADAMLTNHYMIRDGSVWMCRNGCGITIPFPSPMPRSEALGPCVPRRWGDGHPEPVPGRLYVGPSDDEGKRPAVYRPVRGGPTALDRECPKCHAGPGRRCVDLRKLHGETTLRPHEERR